MLKTDPPQPIHNERGLLLKDEQDTNVLVISDIHIGFEEELMRDGIYIPNQTKDILKRVQKIAGEKAIERFVINGDLKHRVPTTQWKYRKKHMDDLDRIEEGAHSEFQKKFTEIMKKMKTANPDERKELQMEFELLEKKKSTFYQDRRKKKFSILEKSEIELKNVAQFLRGLLDIGDVIVIPGNHDGRVQKEMENSYPSLASDPSMKFSGSDGIVIGKAGIFHGHAWPSQEVMAQEYLIMGHGHAAILLTDSLGVKNYEQCWLRASLTEKVHGRYLDAHGEVILMPSFNDFFRGSPVNRKGRLLGPLFKNDFVDVANGMVYLLDGVNLGKVEVLKKFAQNRSTKWL